MKRIEKRDNFRIIIHPWIYAIFIFSKILLPGNSGVWKFYEFDEEARRIYLSHFEQ